MPKGTITGGGEKGQYTVTVNYDTDAYDRTQALLDTQISEYTNKISEAEGKLSELNEKIDTISEESTTLSTEIKEKGALLEDAIQEQQSLIVSKPQFCDEYPSNPDCIAYEAELSEITSEVESLTSDLEGLNAEVLFCTDELTALAKELPLIESELMVLKVSKLSYEKKKTYLSMNKPVDETISAWCADLTEDLSGVVGLIDVPGAEPKYNIKPGYESAAYNESIDGKLTPSVVMTPAQAFYNAALLPGVEKWKPRYRYGTITNVHEPVAGAEIIYADVTLDDTYSSQQNLNVNDDNTIAAPILYMDCGPMAEHSFEEGDKVIVEFLDRDLDNPAIIGFQDNPKPCVWLLDYELLEKTCTRSYSSASVPPPCSPDTFGFDEENNILTIEKKDALWTWITSTGAICFTGAYWDGLVYISRFRTVIMATSPFDELIGTVGGAPLWFFIGFEYTIVQPVAAGTPSYAICSDYWPGGGSPADWPAFEGYIHLNFGVIAEYMIKVSGSWVTRSVAFRWSNSDVVDDSLYTSVANVSLKKICVLLPSSQIKLKNFNLRVELEAPGYKGIPEGLDVSFKAKFYDIGFSQSKPTGYQQLPGDSPFYFPHCFDDLEPL